MSKKNIETAINDYVRAESGGNAFPTGWIMVVSLARSDGASAISDDYLTISSEDLPVHNQLGLLDIAQIDIRNLSMLGRLASAMGVIFSSEEEDDEES